ncbi:TACO1 oxidase, partial [Aegotheles bennettii]|nr:TACO1 oxidase [Aegotheles bennettii]
MAVRGVLALARWPRLVVAPMGRPLHLGGAPSWAGHNRWSKVKNVKGPRDLARSRLFQRLSVMLRAAAREGGPDPALNPQLANVVEQCRAKNMPKASIEAAIRGAGDDGRGDATRLRAEGGGARGATGPPGPPRGHGGGAGGGPGGRGSGRRPG